jgi:hypothetical protein
MEHAIKVTNVWTKRAYLFPIVYATPDEADKKVKDLYNSCSTTFGIKNNTFKTVSIT